MAYIVALALVVLAHVQAAPARRRVENPLLARRALGSTPIATGAISKAKSTGISATPLRFLQMSADGEDKRRSTMNEKVRSTQDGGVPVWKEYNHFRRTYFVNLLTGEQQWSKPRDFDVPLGSDVALMRRARDRDTYVRYDLIESSKVFETRPYLSMEREVHDTDITLAFQGDVSRLSHLREVAHNWHGPVSASLLVLESDIPLVDHMIKSSPAFKRNVDLNLCVAKKEWAYYPVNALRNHANRHARTDYLFIMDGDEDPVQSMEAYKDDLYRAILSTDADPSKTAFIVTSWQWGNSTLPNGEYPRSKADIARLLKDGKAVCKAADFPQAYMPLGVGLEKWIVGSKAEKLPWHDRYEPYMVVHKDTIGSFDERFVGWGGNKAVHILKMQLEKVKFVLLPQVFTFINESIAEDNAKEHTLPADPDLPERAATELGFNFGCSSCSYKECVMNCREGLDVRDYI